MSGIKVRLQLWDTAGQERFRSMVSVRTRSCRNDGAVTSLCVHRLPCTIAERTLRSCCMISLMLLPLKTYADGWKVSMFLIFSVTCADQPTSFICRTEKELFAGPHHLYCWIKGRPVPTPTSHI